MRNKIIITVMCVAVIFILAIGCVTTTQKSSGVGAGIGAALGASIGALVGDPGLGMAIGAGVGVVAGAAAEDIGGVEHAVGWIQVVQARGTDVPERRGFARLQVDVGCIGPNAGRDHVGAGADCRAASPDPGRAVALDLAGIEVVEDEALGGSPEQFVTYDE